MDAEIHEINAEKVGRTQGKQLLEKLLESLDAAVESAKEVRDIELAQDPDAIRALKIVEEFLREKQLLCYGGMAINAHLPPAYKFYDFSKVLPDYDFYTPNVKHDVKQLVDRLISEGFNNVSAREGMHEGTIKIFVNFLGVADMTSMPKWLFTTLHSRAKVIDGIHFVDADFLRMGMYLELSRPKGEVERWNKVYLRLLYLNKAVPPKTRGCGPETPFKIPRGLHTEILSYISKHSLIFAGAELKKVYKQPGKKDNYWILHGSSPILAFSDAPERDAQEVKRMAIKHSGGKYVTVNTWDGIGDIIPTMVGVRIGGEIVALFIHTTACHSYNTMSVVEGIQLRIASIDTLIHLYYILGFIEDFHGVLPQTAHCFANQLVNISIKTRDRGNWGPYEPFPTHCLGHQETKQSLIRARYERMQKKKTKRNVTRKGKHEGKRSLK